MGPSTLLVRMQNGAAATENSMDDPQKNKNRTTICSSNSPSGYVPKRTEGKNTNWCLHTCVHSSIIHKSQQFESIQLSPGEWMGKPDVVCMPNGQLFSLKKERNSSTYCNINETWRHALSEISQSEKTNAAWFHSHVVLGVAKLIDRKNGGCQGPWGGENRKLPFNGDRVSVLQVRKVWR